LRQRRLITLKRDELPRVEDLVQPVAIEGCPLLYCLRSDSQSLALASDESSDLTFSNEARLLAPLDPLVYDRRLTRLLWDFDYTWEVYTPQARRKRGYYALPVLVGTELVGHIDPKADRKRRKLVIVSRKVRRGFSTLAATRELARFLGLKTR
jgi:hypothetical protein